MNRWLVLAAVLVHLAVTGCSTPKRVDSVDRAAVQANLEQAAIAGCATCIFAMKDVTGCKLAVQIDGETYLVVGSHIDDHGDAHASDGLCVAARDSMVRGKIDGDRFVAQTFRLTSP